MPPPRQVAKPDLEVPADRPADRSHGRLVKRRAESDDGVRADASSHDFVLQRYTTTAHDLLTYLL